MEREYQTIKEFYGDKCAVRSEVRLINHIDEGLMILDALVASDLTKGAFCIHPIVQDNVPQDVSWSHSLSLAQEYRDKANSYLCNIQTDHIQSINQINDIMKNISSECVQMLYADKIQNRKDFRLYHRNSHPRSPELERYFNLWIEYLRAKLNI